MMTPHDLPRVQALLGQLGYDLPGDEVRRRFVALTGAPGHVLMIAELGEHPVGALHAFMRPALEKPPEVVIQSLVVEQSQRRAGIGSSLMAAAERWAAGQSLTSIVLASQADREDAHAFYRGLGYTSITSSQVMRKRITP